MANTPNRNYPLVAGGNQLQSDVLKLIALATMLDTDVQALFSALSGKADLSGAAFTVSPTGPTPTAGDDSNKFATTSFVKTAFLNFLEAAPAALDTWLEVVTHIQNDESALAALTTVVGNKANSSDVYLKAAIDTLLAAKASLTGAEELTNKMLTTPVLKLKNSAGAAPTGLGLLEWDTTTGRLKVGTGSATKEFAPNKWEALFDAAVTNQLTLDFDVSLYQALRLTALVKSAGASDNLAWRYSTDGGANFVSTSTYAVQNVTGNVTTAGAATAANAYGLLTAGGISSNANIGMQINAVIMRFPGINQLQVISNFGGYSNSTTIAGALSTYIASTSLPSSAINAIRFLQANAVGFTGHFRLEGIRL